jgi:2-phosphoglycerate kinase
MTIAGESIVVLLNGPAGAGKTTVGRKLAAGARNGVCVHGDDLKGFVVSRDLATVETEVPPLRWTRFDLSGWTVVTVPDREGR